MVPLIVADVGNTRLKWGRCSVDAVEAMVSLPLDDQRAWTQHLQLWNPPAGTCWLLAGPNPQQRERLAEWLRKQYQQVRVVDSHRQVPLRLNVDCPERVGIDRLFNAVAANAARSKDRAALMIGAGTAITVDLLDRHGVFQGGVILPGLRLMTKALHEYTALLPMVDDLGVVVLPAKNTEDAVRSGTISAAVGGVLWAASRMTAPPTDVFLTGGDAEMLATQLDLTVRVWPEMTLEGMRRCAQALAGP
ncbi:MAG: type III pantothenate kinase [Gemmataceae bacterium]|nr:type III pantothenate kinase [Gemmataceae bacterium]